MEETGPLSPASGQKRPLNDINSVPESSLTISAQRTFGDASSLALQKATNKTDNQKATPSNKPKQKRIRRTQARIQFDAIKVPPTFWLTSLLF